MAVNRDKLFEGIENGAAWDAGVVFNRTNGIPLDKWSIFKTYEDATAYAQSNPVAYAGQIIAIVPEGEEPTAYIILSDGSLKVLGSDVGIQSDWNQSDNTKIDYIKNKPNIPSIEGLATETFVEEKIAEINIPEAEQIQSDWAQTDNTQKDFIKNKPTIPSTDGLASETYVNDKTTGMLKYTAQTLTDEQQLQARNNIGVRDSVVLTQEAYDKLLEDGKVVSTTYYYIYEEVPEI